MSKKIYITEAQMKALTRALIKENVNNDKIEELIRTVEPEIEECEGNGDEKNGFVSLLFDGGDCSVRLSAEFDFDYAYNGSRYNATQTRQEEYPNLIFTSFEFYNLELYYLSEMGEGTTITLDIYNPLFDECLEKLEDYQEIIQNYLENDGQIMSFEDYTEDMRERSRGY